MKLSKMFLLPIAALVLIFAFQNCGQPGSLTQSSAQIAKLSEADIPAAGEEVVVDDTAPVVVDDTAPVVVDDTVPVVVDDGVNMCESDLEGAIIKEVKAPSASGASSHLFSHDQSIALLKGQNKILLTAKHDARKINKLDLVMAEKSAGKKIRLFLDREDYVVVQGKTYELSFTLTAAAMPAAGIVEAGISSKGKKTSEMSSTSVEEDAADGEKEDCDDEKANSCKIEITDAKLVEVVN